MLVVALLSWSCAGAFIVEPRADGVRVAATGLTRGERIEIVVSADGAHALIADPRRFRVVSADDLLDAKKLAAAPDHLGRPLALLPSGGVLFVTDADTRVLA